MNIRFLGYSRIDSFPVFYIPNGLEGDIFMNEVKNQGKYITREITIESDNSIDDIGSLDVIGFHDGRFGVGFRSVFSKVGGHPYSHDCFFTFPDFVKNDRLVNVIKDYEIERMVIDGRFIKLKDSSPYITLDLDIKMEFKKDFNFFVRKLLRREKLSRISSGDI